VFLLKYCHNKDLNLIRLRILTKNPKSTFASSFAKAMEDEEAAAADKSEYLNPPKRRRTRLDAGRPWLVACGQWLASRIRYKLVKGAGTEFGHPYNKADMRV
jgi:hypothetical protein